MREVLSTEIEPRSRIYLIMECEGEEYMGCVFFDDSTFCSHICELLMLSCGKPISEISSLDARHLA